MEKSKVLRVCRLLLTLMLLLSESSGLANKIDQSNTQTPPAEPAPKSAAFAQEFLLTDADGAMHDTGLYVSDVWTADNGNGTYTNPVLYADYSDPDVVRVQDDYYMTSSSFSCVPGLPILHSKDLVNWRLIGHALKRYPNEIFKTPQHGNGVWAPSIRYHNDMFYIYWGDPDAGIYMVRSKHPEGPWEEPVLVLAGLGIIDPCPLWDDDGQVYLVHGWAASRSGIKSLLTLRTMNAEGTKVATEGKHIFDGHDYHRTIEGPKLYKRNGYYTILSPAGGVKTGWQVALRSKNIYGPYESKVVLEQGTTRVNGPHQGGWIETPSGQSWFMHFQDHKAYGRVVHLQPVTWQDDWPLMGRVNNSSGQCEPVLTNRKPDVGGHFPVVNPVESDEFNSDALGLQWQWQANPKLTWYALLPESRHLRLFAQALPADASSLWDAGNLLLQKLPGPSFSATTKMTFTPEGPGKRAGLILFGRDYACLWMTKTEDGLSLTQSVCKHADKGQTENTVDKTTLTDNTVYLRVTVSGPEGQCCFSYSADGRAFHELGESFEAKPGKWTGAKVGLFCVREQDSDTGGYADFDWFRIEQ